MLKNLQLLFSFFNIFEHANEGDENHRNGTDSISPIIVHLAKYPCVSKEANVLTDRKRKSSRDENPATNNIAYPAPANERAK